MKENQQFIIMYYDLFPNLNTQTNYTCSQIESERVNRV